jgi:transposase
VDVSSQVLDARVGTKGPVLQVKRTAEGVEALRRFCEEHGVALVVMEATGGLERLPFGQLSAGGLACAVVNPRQVRRFAEAMGYLEKTDRIDAGVIAWFAAAKDVQAQQPPCADQQRLAALVVRLRQLTAMKVVQENQRRLVDEPEVLASVEAVLKLVKAQIRSFERKIAELIQTDPLWRELDCAFRQIKGVADRTIANLLAEMPEIGTLSGKEGGKLAGLAPLAQDSGKHSGRRAVRGGRAGVRSILYVVASVAGRHDPDFIAFRQRLLDAGKPRKVVRIALARKLLVRLNAKARDVRSALAMPIAA